MVAHEPKSPARSDAKFALACLCLATVTAAVACSADDGQSSKALERSGKNLDRLTVASAAIDEAFAIFNDGISTTITASAPVTRFAQPPPGASNGTKVAGPPSSLLAVGSSGRQRLLSAAAAADPSAPIRVNVVLDDLPVDWHEYRQRSKLGREEFIDSRRAAIAVKQDSTINWLKSLGATNIESSWLINHFRADVPAKVVPALINRPEVRATEPNKTGGAPERAWSGVEIQNALRTTNLYAAGIRGHHGGRAGGGRLKLALIEENGAGNNFPVSGHPGFLRAAGDGALGASTLRLTRIRDCRPGFGCSLTGTTSDDSHASHMLQLAAGSIENGQDPTIPGLDTYSQRRRSGQLTSSYLYYYSVSDSDSLASAIQMAVADNADVISMSMGIGPGCDPTDDASAISYWLQAALNAGAVLVKSAGNNSHASGCSLSWPALRRELLVANGVATTNETLAYTAFPINTDASRGGGAITVYSSGVTTPISGVDLVAPGCSTEWYWKSGAAYTYKPATVTACGSSDSAALLNGVIGGMRSAFSSVGLPIADARIMMVNALLMGDGWNADDGTIHTTGMSTLSGAGRVRTHWPSSTDLVGPWGWGWRAVTIHQGETVTWPVGGTGVEPSAVTLWKWAALWTPTDLTSVPDVDFYVDNTCAFGGGTSTLWSDTGYDVRARFRLTQSQISTRCLQMRAYGYSVPPEGVTFYSADYFHSGDPSVH